MQTTPRESGPTPVLSPSHGESSSNSKTIEDLVSTITSNLPRLEDVRVNSASVDQPNINGGTAGRGAAALLLVTHVLELTTMVVMTLSRILPTIHSTPHHGSAHITNSHLSIPYATSLLLVIAHVILLIVPLMVMTGVSLVWTLKAQDFSGRFAARLVCWVLHLFQASLVWRYLKVQLAYDSSDLAELGTLRFVQVHIHTIPFLVLHIASTLSAPKAVGLSLTLGLALLVSSVITIVIATTVRRTAHQSPLTLPTVTQGCNSPMNSDDISHKEDAIGRIVVGITSACVLWCRTISVATLFCLNAMWAVVLILIHWLFVVIWLCFQEEPQTIALSKVRKWLRRSFLAYLLVWDWHVFQDDVSAINVCVHPRLPAIFYSIITAENIAAIVAWFAFNCYNNTSVICIATISSVAITQGLSLLIFALSYFYYSSLLPSWPKKVASIASSRKASLVTLHSKVSLPIPQVITISAGDEVHCPCPTPTSYINYKNVEEEEVINANSRSICITPNANRIQMNTPRYSIDTDLRENIEIINTPKLCSPNAKSTPKYPLSSRLLTHNLPPSIFSFSHDMLPHTSKSERSSTDNGSFNSRNTNTLGTKPAHLAEYDNSYPPHSSFSDSFSSLSCGTIQRNIVNASKLNGRHQTNSLNAKSLIRRHTSCQNGFCHCKIFDVVGHRCQENVTEEEAEQEEEQEKNCVGKKNTAPRVDMVRGPHRFQVVCSACLHSHDPLLTKCRHTEPLNLSQSCGGIPGGGSSTDYPSDTELTATVDTLSSISAESHSTYTTWPVGRGPGLAKLLLLEKGGHDYVTAWLRHQQTRGPPPPPNYLTHIPPRRTGGGRRHTTRQYHQTPSAPLVQDLETVV